VESGSGTGRPPPKPDGSGPPWMEGGGLWRGLLFSSWGLISASEPSPLGSEISVSDPSLGPTACDSVEGS